MCLGCSVHLHFVQPFLQREATVAGDFLLPTLEKNTSKRGSALLGTICLKRSNFFLVQFISIEKGGRQCNAKVRVTDTENNQVKSQSLLTENNHKPKVLDSQEVGAQKEITSQTD